MKRIQIFFFGKTQLLIDGEPSEKWSKGNRDKLIYTVMFFLALRYSENTEVYSRRDLAGTALGEGDWAYKESLRQLKKLQAALGSEGGRLQFHPRRDDIQFDFSDAYVDVFAFEEALKKKNVNAILDFYRQGFPTFSWADKDPKMVEWRYKAAQLCKREAEIRERKKDYRGAIDC